MLMRTDPFRELDRLTQQLIGTTTRPAIMPMDAYRKEDSFVVKFDLPGVTRDAIELTVEQNVLTVRAERTTLNEDGVETVVAERPAGQFTRQLFLGDTLDTDQIEADYTAGVLTLAVPVKQAAKPRKVEIASSDPRQIASS
jgi:HSP20 family protein